MTDPIAHRLHAATVATRSARTTFADRISRLRVEVDGARTVLAHSTGARPALHRALRIARAELRHLVATAA